MTFVLSMSLYGLATLISELIPSVQVGVVEFSVEFFLFIPLTIAMLFDPLSAALGAATGELVFSEFLTVTIAVYIAGTLVKDPRDMKSIALVSLGCTALQLVMSAGVDICKVVFAVEEFEAVPGLPESVFFTEGFSAVNDLLFSGILFCMLPTMFLVPRLYGKIEPLLGMRPRTAENAPGAPSAKLVAIAVACFAIAAAVACFAEAGFSLIEWEAEWAKSEGAIFAGIAVAAVVAVVAGFWAYRSAQLKAA